MCITWLIYTRGMTHFMEVCVTGLKGFTYDARHDSTISWLRYDPSINVTCNLEYVTCPLHTGAVHHYYTIQLLTTPTTQLTLLKKTTHPTTPPQKSRTFPQYYKNEPPIHHSYNTGWRRLMASPKLQIIFHKRATKHKLFLREMTYKDKGSYESSQPYIRLPATTTELYLLKSVSPTTQLCLLKSDH